MKWSSGIWAHTFCYRETRLNIFSQIKFCWQAWSLMGNHLRSAEVINHTLTVKWNRVLYMVMQEHSVWRNLALYPTSDMIKTCPCVRSWQTCQMFCAIIKFNLSWWHVFCLHAFLLTLFYNPGSLRSCFHVSISPSFTPWLLHLEKFSERIIKDSSYLCREKISLTENNTRHRGKIGHDGIGIEMYWLRIRQADR